VFEPIHHSFSKGTRVSHTVSIQAEVRDVAAIRAACQRLNLSEPEDGTFKLFGGEAKGVAVRLPEWTYPVVANVATGELKYDNFAGHWGDPKELDRFVQAYAVEKAKLESRRKGYSASEQVLADGSIKLVINVSGGAA
jgi:hypothetical protein